MHVLNLKIIKPCGSHFSRHTITSVFKLPTRRLNRGNRFHPEMSPAYLELLRVEVAMPTNVTVAAVRSYRTVSPLPDPKSFRPSAVCFLLPYSACHHGWSLAITLPCGVRTFLTLAIIPHILSFEGCKAATA